MSGGSTEGTSLGRACTSSCHHCLRPVSGPVQSVPGQRLKEGRAARLTAQAGHFVLLLSWGCPAGTANTMPHDWAPLVGTMHSGPGACAQHCVDHKDSPVHQCLYWYGKRPMASSPWPPSSVGEGDESLHHVAHVLTQAALRCGP